MRRNLEHPAITRTLRTGYPREYSDPRLCECCGENPIDESCWEVDGLEVCTACMLAMARETVSEDESKAAELLGAVRRSA